MNLFDRMWSIQDDIEKFEFRNGLKGLLDIASAGNQLLQFNEPWKAFKNEPEEVAVVLNLCNQYVAALSLAMHPFMPEASARLRQQLGMDAIKEQGSWVEAMDALANGEHLLADDHVLNQPEHLFTRIEDSWVEDQVKKLHDMSKEESSPQDEKSSEGKPDITFEDFMKLDLRTARIVEAVKVPKADKLLKLTLEVNGTERTVVSGIAEHYHPGEPGAS